MKPETSNSSSIVPPRLANSATEALLIEIAVTGSHGNWWNAMVCAECWSFAVDFFKELTELFAGAEQVCRKLSATYKGISDLLSRAGEKDLADDEKLQLIAETCDQQRVVEAGIRSLLESGVLR